MHKSGQTVGISVWPPLCIEDVWMRHPLLWVGERFWETNLRRSCHQVGSYTNYDVTATHGCGRLYGSQCFGGRITISLPLNRIWWGVGNTTGTWKLSLNLGTWLAVAQCTIWLPHLWGILGIVLPWSSHLQCYLRSTIDEMSWCDFLDTPLPSLETWECLREFWLEWEAKMFDGR